MHTNRLPFAPPRRRSALLPTCVALLLLASVSLAGFAVALWTAPEDPVPSVSRQSDADAAPASGGSFEGGLRVLPKSRESHTRKTWM